MDNGHTEDGVHDDRVGFCKGTHNAGLLYYCKFNRRLNGFNGKGDQFSQARYLPVTHYAGSAPLRSIHPVHKATHAVQEKH